MRRPVFENRQDAGRQLLEYLKNLSIDRLVILAIPRGGVPVAAPMAKTLHVPLGVVPIRALAAPWDRRLIFGYVNPGGQQFLNHALVGQCRLTAEDVLAIARREQRELMRELKSWQIEPPKTLKGRAALLVDDGMHSGWTMFSAIEAVKQLEVHKVCVAVPVTHSRARRLIQNHCDEVTALRVEEVALYDIGNYYTDYSEVDSTRVREILAGTHPAAQPAVAGGLSPEPKGRVAGLVTTDPHPSS